MSNENDFIPNVTGYFFEGYNRGFTHKRAPGTWGGVGFLIKTSLLQHYMYSVVDKCYQGILAIEVVDKYTKYKLLLITGYLPPENSPYGRNADEFYNHIQSLCYTYFSKYDAIYLCGDLNSRIGNMNDYITGVDNNLLKATC